MKDARNRSQWEAPALVAGSLAVLALALGQLLVAGIALAVCAGFWDQSARPSRTHAWQALFVGVPVVVIGFAGWELAHGRWAAGLVLAVFALGAVSLSVFGDWRSQQARAEDEDGVERAGERRDAVRS